MYHLESVTDAHRDACSQYVAFLVGVSKLMLNHAVNHAENLTVKYTIIVKFQIRSRH